MKLTTSKSTSGSSATQTIDLDSSASASEADSDDDSDDDSADDEEDDSEPSPLPAERPIDPRKAIEYDVIKCVWSKKRLNLPGVVIRTALGEYWKIVKGIRDAWKVEIVAMQAAEEKKDEHQAAQRKARAAEQGQLLADVLSLTLVHGHRDIVERYVFLSFLLLSPQIPNPHPLILALVLALVVATTRSAWTGHIVELQQREIRILER